MRYEIKQTRYTTDYLANFKISKESFEDSASPVYKREQTDLFARVCEHCGTEIIASWKYWLIQCNQKELADRGSWFPDIAKLDKSQIARVKEAEKQNGKELKEIDKEVQAFMRKKACPVCGYQLPIRKGFVGVDATRFSNNWTEYLVASPYDQDIDSIFLYLKNERESIEQVETDNEVDTLIVQYDSVCRNLVSSSKNVIEEMHADQLKEYLHKLIKIESNIYSLTERIRQLCLLRPNTNRAAIGSTIHFSEEKKRLLDDAVLHLNNCIVNQEHISTTYPKKVNLPMPKKPEEPTIPVLKKPGIFNKKKVMEENAEITATYNLNCQKYQKDIQNYNAAVKARDENKKRLEQENLEAHKQRILAAEQAVEVARQRVKQAEIDFQESIVLSQDLATPEMASKSLIDRELTEAQKNLQQLMECKYKLWNCNVVFEKYRNLVAISTFYEYLMAGRCTSLEGATGAYNLYETELRANIIIGQLNNVINSLEEIKGNQFVIYNEIQKTNAALKTLNNSMDKALNTLSKISVSAQNMEEYMEHIAQNSDIIAHHTAVNAYYSQINAELTDALGYMVALH